MPSRLASAVGAVRPLLLALPGAAAVRRLRDLLWRLRHGAVGVELWVRQDVGGHAIGCRLLPTQHGDHGPDAVACDCYASVWRCRARLP